MRCFTALLFALSVAFAQQLNVVPAPANVVRGTGSLTIDQNFRIVFSGYNERRLHKAADRFLLVRLPRITGMPPLPFPPPGKAVTLDIHCDHASKPVQAFGEDESYKLTVTTEGARLKAPNPLGILRGLETFLQLVAPSTQGYAVPAVTIEDKPRFPWRGLHIDVSRHWMPMPVILRQLDAMAAVKMNVFHWHLTDDQGFRIESKLYPKLQQMGSDGNFYSQDQVRQVTAYARDRGIRVVPEFDMPGHTTAWFVGMPQLASGPGPYKIERTFGVFAPTMDPTRESTYVFLDRFIGEMAALFPDDYFHIGGDEVSPDSEWKSNARIAAFEKQHGMKTNDDLQAYFNKRVQAIVKRHGKRMEGWDEILNPGLPKDIVIQSWRGVKSLSEAAKLGFQGILSAPYYLDHMEPAAAFYLADPLGGPDAAALTDEQKARILGGEVCSWDEYVTPENIDGRVWPRTAAAAERFWSPASVTDVADLYRRLDVLVERLEWAGLTRETNYRTMLQRLAGGDPIGPLATLASAVGPVNIDGRERTRKYTQQTPLNRLVDTALPENRTAREFAEAVDAMNRPLIRDYLTRWQANDAKLKPTLQKNALLEEIVPVSADVANLATAGLQALDYMDSGKPAPGNWVADRQALIRGITGNDRPASELRILIADPIGKLVDRAAQTGTR